MGAQGLSTHLQRNSRPRVVCIQSGEAAQPGWRRGRVLLVDASAVQSKILDKLGAAAAADPATFHERLYVETCRQAAPDRVCQSDP